MRKREGEVDENGEPEKAEYDFGGVTGGNQAPTGSVNTSPGSSAGQTTAPTDGGKKAHDLAKSMGLTPMGKSGYVDASGKTYKVIGGKLHEIGKDANGDLISTPVVEGAKAHDLAKSMGLNTMGSSGYIDKKTGDTYKVIGNKLHVIGKDANGDLISTVVGEQQVKPNVRPDDKKAHNLAKKMKLTPMGKSGYTDNAGKTYKIIWGKLHEVGKNVNGDLISTEVKHKPHVPKPKKGNVRLPAHASVSAINHRVIPQKDHSTFTDTLDRRVPEKIDDAKINADLKVIIDDYKMVLKTVDIKDLFDRARQSVDDDDLIPLLEFPMHEAEQSDDQNDTDESEDESEDEDDQTEEDEDQEYEGEYE